MTAAVRVRVEVQPSKGLPMRRSRYRPIRHQARRGDDSRPCASRRRKKRPPSRATFRLTSAVIGSAATAVRKDGTSNQPPNKRTSVPANGMRLVGTGPGTSGVSHPNPTAVDTAAIHMTAAASSPSLAPGRTGSKPASIPVTAASSVVTKMAPMKSSISIFRLWIDCATRASAPLA